MAERAPLRRVRVLIVDDSAARVEEKLALLREAGFTPVHKFAEDRQTLSGTLEHERWDVVLADSRLATLSLPDTLDVVRERDADLPVIVVGEAADEELAAEILRAGADEYLAGPSLARLGPAVERALRERKTRVGHRHAIEALQKNEARYRLLFENSPIPMWLFDVDTLRFLEVNKAAVRHYGYSYAEFLRMNIRALRPPEDVPRLLDHIQTSHPLSRDGVWRHRKKDGSLIEVEVTSVAFPLGGGTARLVIAQDITDRLRSEEALRASEERFRAIFEQAAVGMAEVDPQSGRFLRANGKLCELSGYTREELLAKTWSDVIHPEDAAPIAARIGALMAGEERAIANERRYVRKDRRVVWARVTASRTVHPQGGHTLVVVVEDVTERRTLEDQLRQAQKMEAIGSLAGGIAHDFNNLLSIILTYSDMLAEDLPAGSPVRADLEEIHRAGHRAADLTRQLLAFSRQQILEPRVVDLNQIIAGMEKMLRRLIGEDVELAVVASPSPALVYVDPGRMEQVIMNLAVNARDAMPEGGSLTIEIAPAVLDETYAAAHAGVKSGPHVMLAVSDTGIGMDAATQARAFEPFFTTKGPGKGTGLGLSTVFGIVRQSAGSVFLYSESGKGTTFKIYLPEAGAKAADQPQRLADRDLRGDETILLVEDDLAVRKVARSILQRAGYRVVEAENAGDALLICEQGGTEIDLLLTDVVMPRIGGAQLAARLSALRPGLKVLYMSGYTDNAVVLHGVLHSEVAFVQKPITPAALLGKVRDVLDAPPKGA